MVSLTFAAGSDVTAGYRVAGQYLEVTRPEGRSFFAPSSAPGDPRLELLIKDQGGLSATLATLEPGADLQLSEALGTGFPLGLAEGRPLHLFSMGSGIAPLRALIRCVLRGDLRPAGTTLWQGAFDEEHLPYSSEYSDWEAGGVTVFPCLDGPQVADRANVVERLQRASPDLSEALCIWVGSSGFAEAIRDLALSLGARPEWVVSNA